MFDSYLIQQPLIEECPVFAEDGKEQQEWSFLERFPELATVIGKNTALARQIDSHYLKVIEFVERHVAPYAIDIDQKMLKDPNYLPKELLEKACDYKLFSMMFPKIMGGAGVHPIAAFITYELIATHCVGIANLLGVSGLAIACVMATYDLRALSVIAKLICDNERKGIPTFLSTCVTEPGAGSDAEDPEEFEQAILRTTAKKVAGGYLINGNKVFISNGSLAALHVVVAYDAAGKHRPEDMMIFLVDAKSKGIAIPRNEKKMGQRVCPASEIVFDDVFVAENMRCRTGKTKATAYAYSGLSNVLGMTRGVVGGFATGVAEGAYRIALDYVRNHNFLGQPMEQQQWVRIELANLARQAQVSRATYLAALLTGTSMGLMEPVATGFSLKLPNAINEHKNVIRLRKRIVKSDMVNKYFRLIGNRQTLIERETTCAYGDVAKVSCTELAMDNCQRAITLMGKDGLRHEFGAEKLLRDVKLLQIYEGTNQVNLLDFIKRRLVRQFDTAL